MILQTQLSSVDILKLKDYKEIYESDKLQLLTLLRNHINLDEIVLISLQYHYYASLAEIVNIF